MVFHVGFQIGDNVYAWLSTKLISVHFPKQTMFRKNIIGANILCSMAMKRLTRVVWGIPRADDTDMMQIKVFEILESAEMVKHQDGDDFTAGHFVATAAAFFAVGIGQSLVRFDFAGIFFAKIIGYSENIRNFVFGR